MRSVNDAWDAIYAQAGDPPRPLTDSQRPTTGYSQPYQESAQSGAYVPQPEINLTAHEQHFAHQPHVHPPADVVPADGVQPPQAHVGHQREPIDQHQQQHNSFPWQFWAAHLPPAPHTTHPGSDPSANVAFEAPQRRHSDEARGSAVGSDCAQAHTQEMNYAPVAHWSHAWYNPQHQTRSHLHPAQPAPAQVPFDPYSQPPPAAPPARRSTAPEFSIPAEAPPPGPAPQPSSIWGEISAPHSVPRAGPGQMLNLPKLSPNAHLGQLPPTNGALGQPATPAATTLGMNLSPASASFARSLTPVDYVNYSPQPLPQASTSKSSSVEGTGTPPLASPALASVPAPAPAPASVDASSEDEAEAGEDGKKKRKRRRRLSETPRDAANRKFGCEVCGKRFARPSALATHSRSHSKEKPHCCPIETCARAFTVLSNLRRHQTIYDHWSCPEEKAAFAQKDRAKGSPAALESAKLTEPFKALN